MKGELGGHWRVIALILILTTAILITVGVTVVNLYEAAFVEQRARLLEIAQSNARLMEAVARFDRTESRDYPGGAGAATLSQILDARENFEGFGETGEFTLARREGNDIVFLFRDRHGDIHYPEPVPFDSGLAQPMRHALSGRSGTMIGLDYGGVRVLAAYEPVAVMNFGIVAKIDLAEIRAPFIRAGGIAVGIAVIVIVVGTGLFLFISTPMIRRLVESEARYRTLVQGQADLICRNLPDGTLLFVNDVYCRYFRKTREELVGSNFLMLLPEDSRAPVLGGILALTPDHPTMTHEHEVMAPEGKIRWQQWTNAASFDKHGDATEIVAVGRDVTVRKQAEAEAGIRARQQAAVADLSQFAMTATDPPAVMDMAVDLVAKALEVEYSKVLELLPDGAEFLLRAGVGWKPGLVGTARVGAEKKSQAGFTLLSDRAVIVEDFRAERRFDCPPILREHGVVSGMSVIIGDIDTPFGVLGAHSTAPRAFSRDDLNFLRSVAIILSAAVSRGRAQAVLEETAERMRNIAQSLPGSVYRFVVSSDGEETVEYAVGRLRQDLDLDPGKAGAPIYRVGQLTVSEDREARKKAILRAARTLRPYQVEFRVTAPGGDVRWIASRAKVHRRKNGDAVFDGVALDITGQRLVEEALRINEKRLRGAIESMREGFLLCDTEDRVVMVNSVFRRINPKAKDLLEREVRFEELIRNSLETGRTVDAIGREDAFLRERMEQHRNPKGEILREYRDGSWYIIKECRTPEGGIATTFTDVSELKKTENALREKEERIRAITDSAHDAIISVDREGMIVTWNKAAERIFGHAAAEIVGNPVTTIIPKRFRADHREGFFNIGKKSGSGDHAGNVTEVMGLHGNGSEIPIELSVSAWQTDGKPFYTGILRDITNRRRAEERLRKLSRAVEQSPAAIIITDAEGIIEYVNSRFAEITGYSAGESYGKTPRMLKSGKTPDAVYRRLWATIKSGREWQGTLSNRRKDGTIYLAGNSIAPIKDEKGIVTHFVGTQQDITQRTENENRLKHAEKLDSLGSLAGGIAHDFNNMLLPIITLADMARAELPDGSKERKWLEKVVQAGERAKSLVARILAFSRQEDAVKQKIDIYETVNDTMELIRSTLPSTIEIKQHLQKDVGAVFADASQIAAVLMNLMSNAADAMEGETGKITVSLSRSRITQRQIGNFNGVKPGYFAKLSVKDTGMGMDEKILQRALDPFFTTKEVGRGTGLGLSMAHGIVSKHDGAIDISSRPGHGTTIDVYLPVIKARGATPNLEFAFATSLVEPP